MGLRRTLPGITAVTCRFLLPSEMQATSVNRNTAWTILDLLGTNKGSMKTQLACSVLLTFAVSASGRQSQKPRVFITESGTPQASDDSTVGDAKSSVAFTGGSSPQSIEVMKAFSQRCPDVIGTADREKAEYVVRLDHEPISPTTPFVHGNKVAIFNKSQDLIYSNSTRTLSSAVKGACRAITAERPSASNK